MTDEAKFQLERDVAALAAFEPRKRALRMLAEGRAEDYLYWAMDEGYRQAHGKRRGDGLKGYHGAPAEPMGLPIRCAELSRPAPLDEVLFYNRTRGVLPGDAGQIMRQAMDGIELFMASALEIALDSSPLDVFERTLSALTSVKARASGAFSPRGAHWTTLAARASCAPENTRFRAVFGPDYGLLAKAVLQGKPEFAQAMIRHGLHPQSIEGWRDLGRDLIDDSFQWSAERELELLGASDSDVARLWEWIDEKAEQMEEIERLSSSIVGGDSPAPDGQVEQAASAIKALFSKGAPATSHTIMAAIENGRADLMEAALDAGGDPNCTDGGGDLVMSWIDLSRMDKKMFEIWLARGGRIILNSYVKNPFADDDRTSPAINIAKQGRLDLLKQASADPVAPFKFTVNHKGATYAPLLAVAIGNGHAELAKWLVVEKGCSLSHLDDESGSPCSELASGHLLAGLVAEEERLALAEIRAGGGGADGRL